LDHLLRLHFTSFEIVDGFGLLTFVLVLALFSSCTMNRRGNSASWRILFLWAISKNRRAVAAETFNARKGDGLDNGGAAFLGRQKV
jgi:hypothetical protein